MKKLLLLLLIFITSTTYSADQWDSTVPLSTANPSDLDDLFQENNMATNRITYDIRNGCSLIYIDASTFKVLPGSITIVSSDNIFRRNTSSTTVTWSDLDDGDEDNDTIYYVYATAETDTTTFDITISVSSSAPTSITNYRLIGWFYNDEDGAIRAIGNVNKSYTTSISDTISEIKGHSSTYIDLNELNTDIYSSGGVTTINFSGSFSPASNESIYIAIYIDNLKKSEFLGTKTTLGEYTISPLWSEELSVGEHSISIKYKTSDGSVSKNDCVLVIREDY